MKQTLAVVIEKRSIKCCISLFIVLLLTTTHAWGLDRPPWEKLTTNVGPDAEVPGWYINLGVTGARAMITKRRSPRTCW